MSKNNKTELTKTIVQIEWTGKPGWRNWQPRTVQDRMSKDMGVQVPSRALELGRQNSSPDPFLCL